MRFLALAVALSLLRFAVPMPADAVAGAGLPMPMRWQRLPLAAAENEPIAVDVDASGARLAVAIPGGVLAGPISGPLVRVLRRGPVHDVLFDRDGAILAATGVGLFRIDADGEVRRLRVGSGEEQRAALRIAHAAGLFAVATAGGVFASRDGATWHRLQGLPAGPASVVALRPMGAGHEVWSVIEGQLWITPVRPNGPGRPPLASGASQRLRIPSTGEAPPVDLVFWLPGAESVVLFPRALAVRARPDAARPAEGWQVLRPPLPPGAAARRIGVGLGRAWLATDAGLLLADALEGPWERATPPAGSAEVRDAVGGPRALHLATDRALLRAVVSVATPIPRRTAEPTPDPWINDVHRAALRHLSLEPARMESLWQGVSRRGWLPFVSVHVGEDRDSIRRRDYDQSFVSGGTHQLYDAETDSSRDLALGLTMTWNLGDLAYHPESIDVSREARAVTALRDDVLDEITQLYFERRRVLLQLSALDPASSEAQLLRLRAAELAAGLDAWTGGWFTRNAPPP